MRRGNPPLSLYIRSKIRYTRALYYLQPVKRKTKPEKQSILHNVNEIKSLFWQALFFCGFFGHENRPDYVLQNVKRLGIIQT